MRRLTLKSQADDLEAEMNDIRKRLTTQQKESNGIQKALTALEIKLEQKRADRHSLLKSCKVLAACTTVFLLLVQTEKIIISNVQNDRSRKNNQ